MFFRHRTSSPASLDTWLAIATRDLVPSAQARIRAEIAAHYAEAVQAHVENGSAESAAHATALADLGNAKSAHRRFQKEHLTQRDAVVVAGVIKRSERSQISGLFGLLGIFILGSFIHPPGAGANVFLGFCFLYALDVPGVYYGRTDPVSLAWIDPPSAHLINLFRIHSLVSFSLGLGCLLYGGFLYLTGSEHASSVVLPILACIFSALDLLRLRKKLQLLDKNYRPAISGGSAA